MSWGLVRGLTDAEFVTEMVHHAYSFFFPGPRNARVIVELPVGTLNAKFKEMERTPDAIGQ